MEKSDLSRRKFIRNTLGTSLIVAGSGLLPSWAIARTKSPKINYDSKGLPTAVLGKTGVNIPRIACGLGSRFCSIEKTEDAVRLLNYALDNGLYYWDTAWAYENKDLGITSEERLGEVVKSRRDEIFLSTKVPSRDPEEAMRQIETSLKRLKTDHLDILKIHDVQTPADVDVISSKGNLIDIVLRMKEQGVTRFIGFSGHTEATALKMMADKGIFDTMLMAMNHYGGYKEQRQEMVIPAAKAQEMGVMLMKVVRPRETVKGLDPKDLIRYALSLKGPDGIVLGMDSMDVVKSNIEILRNFKPMQETRMKEIALQLAPFYNHQNLPWMTPGYRDGNFS
jgi:predicted aldo/keto reductase-like oxidoreductase